MPHLTERPWFGPKRFGWGWTPVTWQGWLVVIAFVAAIVLTGVYLRGAMRILVEIVLIVILLAVSWLTSDRTGSMWGR